MHWKFAAFWLVLPLFACRPQQVSTVLDPVSAQGSMPVAMTAKREAPLPSPEEATCQAFGGTSKKLFDDSGVRSFCELGRSLISQTTLHAHHTGAKPKVVEVFLAHPRFPGKPERKLQLKAMGNPSRLYCLQVGGKVVDMESDIGLIGICKMPDGSMMAAWTLFNGPEASRELSVALDRRSPEIDRDLAIAPTPKPEIP